MQVKTKIGHKLDKTIEQTVDFNALYGEANRPYGAVADWELSTVPKSRMQVDSIAGSKLSRFLDEAKTGCDAAKFLVTSAPILWVINKHGQLILAYEEYVDEETGASVGVRGVNFSSEITVGNRRVTRIGHPSLVPDNLARIGGELRWRREDNSWELSNRSGRFGLGPEHTEFHLQNVKQIFRQHGIVEIVVKHLERY